MRALRCLYMAIALGGLLPVVAAAQGLTGSLSGTVQDEQGGVLSGAAVRLSSAALPGGDRRTTSDERGQWRFPILSPGEYVLTIEHGTRFAAAKVEGIAVGAGSAVNVPVTLKLAGVAESVTVTESSSFVTSKSGLETRVGSLYFDNMPAPRASMFDAIRTAPGISPTSPSSVTTHSVSAFGSAVNGASYLIDGTNFTCPCQGVSRAEPIVDVIKEMHVQSTGASVEYGNIQGPVFNAVTKQGGDRYQGDVSYYAQPGAFAADPVHFLAPTGAMTGYQRVRYRDLSANAGGPIMRDRLWFFGAYQYLHDYDSQPGADPAFPRKYEQDKFFAKLTWRLTPTLQLMQSFHEEVWVNPQVPTPTTPFIATTRPKGTVPSMTFAHLTHVVSDKTFWDARIGRFTFDQEAYPSSGDLTTPSHMRQGTNVLSHNAPAFGTLWLDRITAKAVLNRYEPGWWGGDHQLRAGTEIERGLHRATQAFTGGIQYVDTASGGPLQTRTRDPWTTGGEFITSAVFISDSITTKTMTFDAGIRFDHVRAISQDLENVDDAAQPAGGIINGLGTLYTWNLLSPRLGATIALDSRGRTRLRASYGRFHQGVLTGELDVIHPGVSTITTRSYDAATGEYTNPIVVDPKINLSLDSGMRAPRTDEFSLAFDRQLGSTIRASAAYIRKRGGEFIGWTDTGGQYVQETRTLSDGTVVPVWALTNSTRDRRFLLTNPDTLFLEYDGLVLAAERRLSGNWSASGSYTFSRAYGTQVTSNAPAAEAQFSTIARPQFLTFGQDPNDLTNAVGRLANDRPHAVRVNGVIRLPWYGLLVSSNLQMFSGRPWAAAANVPLPQTGNQPTQRILLEPKGSRRLSSSSVLDVRVAKNLALGRVGTVDMRLDVLNLLNDTAEEGLRSDVKGVATFGQPNVVLDPRRVMLSVRLSLGG